MDFLTSRIRAVFSNCPVASWKRKLNNSSFNDFTFCSISVVVSSLISLAFIAFTTNFFTSYKFRFNRQFVSSETQCFTCNLFWHTCDFKHYFSWLYYCHPAFRSTFSGTHTNFEGLCSIWFVRKYFNPYFTATFHVTGHCNTGSFNLTACNPRGFSCLQAVFTKRYRCAAFCAAIHFTTMLSAIFHTFRH